MAGKSLRLNQVIIDPDAQGFGLDLTDFNVIVGVLQNGAASRTDLKKGDIIVGIDGVNLGARRVAEVLKRGRDSYVFNVIRPYAEQATAKVDLKRLEPPNGSAALSCWTRANSYSCPTVSAGDPRKASPCAEA